jgi:hypothetical protein
MDHPDVMQRDEGFRYLQEDSLHCDNANSLMGEEEPIVELGEDDLVIFGTTEDLYNVGKSEFLRS